MQAKGHLILGYEACLWGEFIPDVPQLEHQAYPRAAAIAEFCWSADERRNFDDFRLRMLKEFERLDARHISGHHQAAALRGRTRADLYGR